MGKTGSNQIHIARHFCTQLKGVVPFTAPVEGRAFRQLSFPPQSFCPLDWTQLAEPICLNYVLQERSHPFRCILPTVIFFTNVIKLSFSGLTSGTTSSLIFLCHWKFGARYGHSGWRQYTFSCISLLFWEDLEVFQKPSGIELVSLIWDSYFLSIFFLFTFVSSITL